MLWDALIDHGREAWLRMKTLTKQQPADEGKFLGYFRDVW
jgi:hypothetical protein